MPTYKVKLAPHISKFLLGIRAEIKRYVEQHEQNQYGIKVVVPNDVAQNRDLLKHLIETNKAFDFVSKSNLRKDRVGKLWLSLEWSAKN